MAAPKKFVMSLLGLVSLVNAQQGTFPQCGGIGWIDKNACGSGTYCSSFNPYYCA